MVKQIPNLITLCNLFCGVSALAVLMWGDSGSLFTASYLVLLAGILDFLDGFTAKLLHAQSEIGLQLDSLADMVTFGTVPPLILITIQGYDDGMEYQHAFALLIPIFSAARLARYNVLQSGSSDFVGMPTPAAAFFVAGLVFLQLPFPQEFIWVLDSINNGVLPLLICFLLVAPIKMFSLKMKGTAWSSNKWSYIFLITALCLILTLQFASISLIIFAYLIMSILYHLLSKSE